jgi:hypothetical protein
VRELRRDRQDHPRHRRGLAAFGARVLVSGIFGSLSSALVALAYSRAENGRAGPPINAISHIYDGVEPPPAGNGHGGRNSLLGFGIHTCASIFWAVFYRGALRAADSSGAKVAAAASISALAYHVDYHVVHRRFRPGFETYLSRRGLFAVYFALAGGFAASALLTRRSSARRPPAGSA